MYLETIFNSASVMYDQRVECANTVTNDGLLPNQVLEFDKAPWLGVFKGDQYNENMDTSVTNFAVATHNLQVDSLLFTEDPSIIDIGLNFDSNISAFTCDKKDVSLKYLA